MPKRNSKKRPKRSQGSTPETEKRVSPCKEPQTSVKRMMPERKCKQNVSNGLSRVVRRKVQRKAARDFASKLAAIQRRNVLHLTEPQRIMPGRKCKQNVSNGLSSVVPHTVKRTDAAVLISKLLAEIKSRNSLCSTVAPKLDGNGVVCREPASRTSTVNKEPLDSEVQVSNNSTEGVGNRFRLKLKDLKCLMADPESKMCFPDSAPDSNLQNQVELKKEVPDSISEMDEKLVNEDDSSTELISPPKQDFCVLQQRKKEPELSSGSKDGFFYSGQSNQNKVKIVIRKQGHPNNMSEMEAKWMNDRHSSNESGSDFRRDMEELNRYLLTMKEEPRNDVMPSTSSQSYQEPSTSRGDVLPKIESWLQPVKIERNAYAVSNRNNFPLDIRPLIVLKQDPGSNKLKKTPGEFLKDTFKEDMTIAVCVHPKAQTCCECSRLLKPQFMIRGRNRTFPCCSYSCLRYFHSYITVWSFYFDAFTCCTEKLLPRRNAKTCRICRVGVAVNAGRLPKRSAGLCKSCLKHPTASNK